MQADRRTSFSEFITTLKDEILKQIRVSLPGQIISFDTNTQLAQVQIGVKTRLKTGGDISPSPIIEIPVYFPGGDFMIEYEISEGTEGIILFSHRDITSWLTAGSVQELASLKKFDVGDCFFVPGLRSQDNKIENFQNDGIQLRNVDRSSYIWLKNDGSIQIQGSTVSINGKDFETHQHDNVPPEGTYTAPNGGGPVTGNSGEVI